MCVVARIPRWVAHEQCVFVLPRAISPYSVDPFERVCVTFEGAVHTNEEMEYCLAAAEALSS